MITDEQIKEMVQRFLSWKLPKNFNPDAGISFDKYYNIGTEFQGTHEPVGTNLFNAVQAEEMVRHMVSGLANADRPEGSLFSKEEHYRYVIRDDVPPTVHARMNEKTGRWESPVGVRSS